MSSVSLEAHELVAGDRRKQYGDPRPLFNLIAKFWSPILKVNVTAKQVATCMVLLKLARETIRPKHDNRVDSCGYTNIMDELQSYDEYISKPDPQILPKRKVVYISGPMTGYPDWNYPAFHEAEDLLLQFGFEVLNPARSFGSDTSRPRKDYMRKAYEMVLKSDVVFLLPGWEDSEGAVKEVETALELDLDFMFS